MTPSCRTSNKPCEEGWQNLGSCACRRPGVGVPCMRQHTYPDSCTLDDDMRISDGMFVSADLPAPRSLMHFAASKSPQNLDRSSSWPPPGQLFYHYNAGTPLAYDSANLSNQSSGAATQHSPLLRSCLIQSMHGLRPHPCPWTREQPWQGRGAEETRCSQASKACACRCGHEQGGGAGQGRESGERRRKRF